MANKKFKAISAASMAAVMMVALVGCGKPTPKKLADVAVKEFQAEELKVEDLEDLDEGDAQHLDDGFVLHGTGEELEDQYEDEIEKYEEELEEGMKAAENDGVDIEDALTFDPTDWGVEDLGEFTVYVMADGVAKPESDLLVQGAAVIEFTDKDKANELMADLGEKFVEDSEIEVKNLNKGEFSYSKNKFQFIMTGDGDELAELAGDFLAAMLETSDSSDEEAKHHKEEIKEMKKEIKEEVENLQYTLGIYYNNGTLTIICGVTMDDELDQISQLAKALGVKDPLTVEMSDEMHEAIINYMVESAEGTDIDKYI